ncbi:hypothetical protein GWI33_005032 [Rhynchophorus ferrugineus]|uniref:Uncharacterized protein n=1 Tax=Rhynchophorus ferrugineus TaxID=354439 RepID=A0A834IJW5_RHYFE|nr:hypothetical protein GWI33_005032 [Rhynchophorus ferrugineus]
MKRNILVSTYRNKKNEGKYLFAQNISFVITPLILLLLFGGETTPYWPSSYIAVSDIPQGFEWQVASAESKVLHVRFLMAFRTMTGGGDVRHRCDANNIVGAGPKCRTVFDRRLVLHMLLL